MKPSNFLKIELKEELESFTPKSFKPTLAYSHNIEEKYIP